MSFPDEEATRFVDCGHRWLCAWCPIHAQDCNVMIVLMYFFQTAFLYIEHKDSSRAASNDAVFAVWTDAKFIDSRVNHQILLLQNI